MLKERNPVGLDSTAAVRDHVCSELVDGQTIILDMRQGKYLGLDHVGGNIWSLVLLQKPLREIVDTLAEQYSAEKTRISDDVIRFVTELQKRGLVDIRQEQAT